MAGTLGMQDDRSRVMDTLLRMIVPFRREFQRHLDVQYFLHDFTYRQDIIQQALNSRDARLRDYAVYLQKVTSGPRVAGARELAPGAPASPPAAAGGSAQSHGAFIETLTPQPPGAPAPAPGEEPAKSAEEQLRDQIMRKYTSGLR